MSITQGYYSVLKYRADSVRDETKNLGVILTSADGKICKVKHVSAGSLPEAVQPKSIVYSWLESLDARCDAGISSAELETLSSELWDTLIVTSPKRTAVLNEDWNAALMSLWKSFAAPPPGGGRGNFVSALASRLRAEINSHVVYRDHALKSSTAGIPRRVDFFANSGANVGVDHLKLALKKEDEIWMRADAEANKVRDILESNPVELYVLCEFSQERTMQDVNRAARAILLKSNAKIVESVEDAKRVLVGAP